MPVLVSDADWAAIQEIARAVREGRINTPSRPPTTGGLFGTEDYLAPEVYIAKPQSAGGIPALSGDTPGSDTCDIYRVGTDGDLAAVTGVAKEIFNLSAEIIPQEFVLVERTKYGKWFAVVSGGLTAAILFGLTTGTVASTDETFSCDGIVVLSPVGAAVPSDPITGIQNILHFPAANDDEVLIFRLKATSTYYGIPHPTRTACP